MYNIYAKMYRDLRLFCLMTSSGLTYVGDILNL